MKKSILAVGVWYFVVLNGGGAPVTQIGPFATQAACDNYGLNPSSHLDTLACFSTAAKQ